MPGATEYQISPSDGPWNCVMRYLYDWREENPADGSEKYPLRVKPRDWVIDILKGVWPWPDTFCDDCGCRDQIQVSDAAQ